MWRALAALVLLLSLTGRAAPVIVYTGSPFTDYLLASLVQQATGEVLSGAAQGVLSAFNENPYECREVVLVRGTPFCTEKWR